MNEEEKQELETLRAEKLRREQVERARAALERGGVPQSFASLLAGGDDGDTDRRTEEFRAQAIQRLHETVSRQRSWCGENSTRYKELLSRFIEKLQSARDILQETDLSGFDDMLRSLDELDEELDK